MLTKQQELLDKEETKQELLTVLALHHLSYKNRTIYDPSRDLAIVKLCRTSVAYYPEDNICTLEELGKVNVPYSLKAVDLVKVYELLGTLLGELESSDQLRRYIEVKAVVPSEDSAFYPSSKYPQIVILGQATSKLKEDYPTYAKELSELIHGSDWMFLGAVPSRARALTQLVRDGSLIDLAILNIQEDVAPYAEIGFKFYAPFSYQNEALNLLEESSQDFESVVDVDKNIDLDLFE